MKQTRENVPLFFNVIYKIYLISNILKLLEKKSYWKECNHRHLANLSRTRKA